MHTEVRASFNRMHNGWLDPSDQWTMTFAGTQTSSPFYQEGGSDTSYAIVPHTGSSVTLTFSAQVADRQ